MDFLLVIVSEYLIDVMFAVLIIALGLRFMAYRSNKQDQLYYSTFTREIAKRVERDDISKVEIEDAEVYIEELLDEVGASLPSRGLRVMTPKKDDTDRNIVTVREYAGGSQSLIHSLKSETNAFKAKQIPNFEQLTQRVLSKDTHWVKLYNIFQIEGITRMIDVLPGIFIVVGIFGTFVGITNALPRIAEIDFNNISNSSSVLSIFVKDVSFAMKTSIAGIAFSLIISLLNTLYPLANIRNIIAREVEDCLEYLWYFVHGGRGENQQAEAFAEMVVLLENIDEKIEDPNSDVIRNNKDGVQQTAAFSKMLELLENIADKFDQPAANSGEAGTQGGKASSTKSSRARSRTTKSAPSVKKAG